MSRSPADRLFRRKPTLDDLPSFLKGMDPPLVDGLVGQVELATQIEPMTDVVQRAIVGQGVHHFQDDLFCGLHGVLARFGCQLNSTPAGPKLKSSLPPAPGLPARTAAGRCGRAASWRRRCRADGRAWRGGFACGSE